MSTPNRLSIMREKETKTTHISAKERAGKNQATTSHLCKDENTLQYSRPGEQLAAFWKMGPRNCTLGTHPKKRKLCIHTIYMKVFIIILSQQQPRCPFTGKAKTRLENKPTYSRRRRQGISQRTGHSEKTSPKGCYFSNRTALLSWKSRLMIASSEERSSQV